MNSPLKIQIIRKKARGEMMKHTRGNLTIAGALTSYERGCELAIHSPGGYLRMAILPYRKNIEDDARRFVALWNAAERLGLTTENIESGVLEKALKDSPELLAKFPEIKAVGTVGEETKK